DDTDHPAGRQVLEGDVDGGAGEFAGEAPSPVVGMDVIAEIEAAEARPVGEAADADFPVLAHPGLVPPGLACPDLPDLKHPEAEAMVPPVIKIAFQPR